MKPPTDLRRPGQARGALRWHAGEAYNRDEGEHLWADVGVVRVTVHKKKPYRWIRARWSFQVDGQHKGDFSSMVSAKSAAQRWVAMHS